MIVTLTGYRGSGKSTVGPLLAEQLGWTFADSDREIEQQSGRSIPDIFAQDGEPAFRQIESRVLEKLLQQSQLILATGGGAILADTNRELMRSAGPVVWLRASEETLRQRISSDEASGNSRPGLIGSSSTDEVAAVLQIRRPLYQAAATVTVDVDHQTPVQIVDAILQQVDVRSGEVPS